MVSELASPPYFLENYMAAAESLSSTPDAVTGNVPTTHDLKGVKAAAQAK